MGHINFGGEMVAKDNKKGLFDVYFEHKKVIVGKEKIYPINMKWRHIPVTNNLGDMKLNTSFSET